MPTNPNKAKKKKKNLPKAGYVCTVLDFGTEKLHLRMPLSFTPCAPLEALPFVQSIGMPLVCALSYLLAPCILSLH
jgi:hypothetical protein